MILNFSLLLICLSTLFIYFYRVDRFQLTPLATNFHLFGATIYVVGTLLIFDQSDTMHLEWAFYCLINYIFLILGTIFASSIFRFDFKIATENLANFEWQHKPSSSEIPFILFMALISALATFYFFSLIGAVIPIEAAINLAQGADIGDSGKSAIEARKSIHYGASGEYYGAGYFSQFTNTILPLSCLLLIFAYRISSNRLYLILFIIFMPIAVLAMTGTGRRGVIAGFIFFIIMWSRWKTLSEFRPSGLTRTSIIVFGVILVGFLTTVIARDIVSENPIINSLYGFLFIFDRVFISPSAQELETFEIFLANSKSTNGAGWLVQLNDILPGHRPSLANEIHALLGGNEFGNAGFGVYGEKYYNFGWMGILVSFIWGFILYAFDSKILSTKKKGFIWIVLCYSAFCLGMAASPIDLFNGGFITCFIYLLCFKIFNTAYKFLLISQQQKNNRNFYPS
tara:strand:+ start:271 stop:1635 length:1365 start_codon:yes stop_codon:yes gene_type:complete